jgi:ECF transporter S component (folate family)
MNNNALTDGINRRRNVLYKITVSAVFLSFAVVLKTLTAFYLPVLGAAGLKIDFSGIFIAFPALMFGPLYGGTVYALADLLGYLIKPSGAYIPLMTLTAFMSGFLTGWVWRFAFRNKKNNSRVIAGVTAVFFLLLGLFGVVLHASLNADNIINGLTADSRQLPTRGILESAEMSPLSRFVCGLARYSNDTIAVTRAPDGAELIAIPETAEIDGYPYKITKIAANAFEATGPADVFLSSNITSVDSAAFGDAKQITIFAPADSFSAVFAADNCFNYIAADYNTFVSDEVTVFTPTAGNYDITNKFGENLAGYINFLTVGFEIISLFVLAVIGSGFIFSYLGKRDKKSNTGEESTVSRESAYIPILFAIFLPRLLITTINTEILRQFFTIWNGRAFIVLWIPRAAEEVLSGIIQSYIIMLLYAVYEGKLKKRRFSYTKYGAK